MNLFQIRGGVCLWSNEHASPQTRLKDSRKLPDTNFHTLTRIGPRNLGCFGDGRGTSEHNFPSPTRWERAGVRVPSGERSCRLENSRLMLPDEYKLGLPS